MVETRSPAWPRKLLTFRMLGLVLAFAAGVGFGYLRYQGLHALGRFYLPAYARAAVFGDDQFPGTRAHRLPTFHVVYANQLPASEAVLLAHPDIKLSVRAEDFRPTSFAAFLKENVYDGQTVMRILRWPLIGFWLCLVGFVGAGIKLDRERSGEARDGRLLRGPYLMNRWGFNRKTKGDGLRFRLTNPMNLFERLMPGGKGRDLVIRRNREAHHIQIAGDTGTGKSSLIRQIIYQIEQRGETAIIFDPDREYIQEFYNEKRGDWVLNPKDERCPYWPIGKEADDEATATPIATGFFPDTPTRLDFFVSHTRAIFTYLLAKYKPTVNELAFWMAHPEEIDIRVEGTEHEHTLTHNAPQQRAGILGSLNGAGKPLRMLPTSAERRRTWTVREWAKKRQGWLFITSTPDTLEAVRPLQSLWLDMLILKLQSSEATPGLRRVWMIIDELASLNVLPQLMSALTKQRKSDNPIVLGFQSMAQIADAYGDKRAETILSQSFTNFMLRTRESRAAKHGSEMIGKAQLERIRESKPTHSVRANKQGSYSSERVIDPVVLESELQGLDDLTGYFVQLDTVVPISFEPFPKRKVAAGLIERSIPMFQTRQLDPKSTSLEEMTLQEKAAARKKLNAGRAEKAAEAKAAKAANTQGPGIGTQVEFGEGF